MNYLQKALLKAIIKEGKVPPAAKTIRYINQDLLLEELKNSEYWFEKESLNIKQEEPEDFEKEKMAEEDRQLLDAQQKKITTLPGHSIPILRELRFKYPEVPTIYNYLSIAYLYKGNQERFLLEAEKTVKLFPDYFYGKITLAEYYLYQKKADLIPPLFNNELKLTAQGDGLTYHITEVLGFYYVLGTYFLQIDKRAEALGYALMMNDLDPKDHRLQKLAKNIIIEELDEYQGVKKQKANSIASASVKKKRKRRKK